MTYNIGNLFQSTRPHGTRLAAFAVSSSIFRFNPRARMGRDGAELNRLQILNVSIHAPAWDATRDCHATRAKSASFNPRARMGRDLEATFAALNYLCFNPRARMGRDSSFARWL